MTRLTRLTRVELRRLLRRRLTLFVVLGILAAVGLQLFQTGMQARPMSASERVRVSADYERARLDYAQNGEQQRTECLQSQDEARASDPTADFGCDTQEPTLAMFLKPQLSFADEVPDVLGNGALLLLLAALVVGAGFTASEFTTGSIGTWLTFEPRRLRVYGSKLLAAAAGLVPLAVVTFALLTAGVWVFASLWGRTTAPAGTWSHVAAVGGRGVVLAAAVAVVGSALGFLLRHTAAVLGVALGYAIVGEGIVGSNVQALRPWLLATNVTGWLQHGTTYFSQVCTTSGGGYSCNDVQHPLSFTHSATFLGVLTLALVLLTALVFRRRDVR
jgi:ABC-2 type transport system permease protein